MMPSPPPLLAPKSKKIPTWVWVLTIVGVLLMVGLYSAMYWGLTKVQDFARTEITKANPEFELLYFGRSGKWKVRHKPTGREFSIDPPRKSKIELLPLTTKEVKPAPEWIKLNDVAPNAAKGGWDRAGDTGLLIERLEDLFLDHDFAVADGVVHKGEESTLSACNAKLLECVVITAGLVEDQDNRSWYSAKFYTAH